MTNWSEYIDKALTRLSGRKKASALPQLSLKVPATTDLIAFSEESLTRRERQVKQRLSYQLFEKMRRRALSWKSYYYYDRYDISRLAITNENATGTHITERRHIVPEDRIFEANFYTDENASAILVDVNDLEEVHRTLFDQLKAGAIGFQVYDKIYPLEIWFDSDRKHAKQLFPLGKHKICIDAQRAYLLRPFRNLGADGFAALSNRLLAQEGIAVDPKNTIESLLIELGNEELMHHYQQALSLYNQQASMRRSSSLPDEELPLIITKTHQRTRPGRPDNRAIFDQTHAEPISEEAYELLALVFERHCSEIEEDLMHLSLAGLSLDRGAVSDSCAILKDKLCFYAETASLQDSQLEHFYQFMQRLLAEEESLEPEDVEYSPLEDQAYETILVELLEDIRDITTDLRYMYYPPIRVQIDALHEPIESLAQALEDAEDKKRRREINDKREILTKKAFEVPNSRTYMHDKTDEQVSFYERLLEIQKTVHHIQEQINLSAYDVASSLAKSAYILAQLHLKQFPELRHISNQLTGLMQTEPTRDYENLEIEFVETLALLTTDLHRIISAAISDQLMQIAGRLKEISTGNRQYTEDNWDAAYTEFIHRDVTTLNNRVREGAIKRYEQIAQQLDYQFQLIETFISGVSVPALLPAQLHESGKGLQTYLVEQLKKYLDAQNLQLQSVPGREKQLRSLIHELMPSQMETPLEQLEYFFMSTV